VTHLYDELYQPLALALHHDAEEPLVHDGALALEQDLTEELYVGERWDRAAA
jgi:hypothetical protein